MAITTDSLYSVTRNDVTYDTIGLSKTLNNYTASEIWDYVFCSSTSNQLYHIGYGGASMTYYTYQGSDNYVPLELIYQSTNHNQMRFHPDQVMNNPDGLYMRIIWLQRTANGSDKYITRGNNNYKLITMFNAPHYVYECNTPRMVDNTHGATSWNAGGYLYYSDGGSLYYYDNVASETPIRINIPRVVPAVIFKDRNDNVFILPYRQSMAEFITKQNTEVSGWSPSCANQFYDWTGEHCIAFPVVCSVLYSNLNAETGALTSPFSDGDRLPEGSGIYARGCYGVSPITHLITTYECGGSASTAYGLGFRTVNYFRDVENCKKFFSLAGLYFKADKIYKPVITGGYVNGFTDDLTTPSDLDNWDGKTKHDVPPTPPSPGPTPSEGDDFDEHEMGAGSQLSGIAQLWLLTRAQLIALHNAFASAPVNYDPMTSFISVMGIGISALRVVGDSMPWTLNPINIKMSNGETWHTGVEGHIVDSQVSAFNEVGIHVQRKYNNFLDYSPYATHEIFLPMCGWVTLPDIAVDRGITVTYIPDIETLKVRAVVSVVDNSGYRCVVGEKDGVMGAEIPFTNIGHSLFLGNTVVQSADIAGEIVTGAIGAGFTKTNAKGGTYRPYEGFTIGMAGTLPGAIGNALVSGNVNRTHFTTGNGTRIGFGDGENIQIKSTYHRIDKPNNYDHTVGKVCNKTGQLSNFTGFTVCDNPHINFSATEREKEEIKQLLEQGVIL